MAKKITGATISATVSVNQNTGQYQYSFSDPFAMQINLANSSDIIIKGNNSNDFFRLMNSSGVTISAGNGNNIFDVSAGIGGLNDNIIRGGKGVDFITLNGSNSVIDLTGSTSGIEAVIGGKSFTGESVKIALNQLNSSALTDGANGRAFAAVIGSTGVVDVVQTGKFKLVGIVDSASHGFTATGEAITGDALTSLLASVTQVGSITGNLASLYAGSSTGKIPTNETQVSGALSAYVFSDGSKSYTIWTDGTIAITDTKGNALPSVYQPALATPAQSTSYGTVSLFDKTGTWAGATVHFDNNGIPDIKIQNGTSGAVSSITLTGDVSDTSIHGDAGENGMNWFGLGKSGGYNKIYGSKGGSIFDLQSSTELLDILKGGSGFNIVRASADGASVDMTIDGSSTGKASIGIDAVVGGSNAKTIQSVAIDVGKINYSLDSSGIKSGVFVAMLGSAEDTLTLTGNGKWVEAATFSPGSALPEHAQALANAAMIDAAFGSTKYTAENALIGHLFEQLNNQGQVVKYMTVYTDATIDNALSSPLETVLALHGHNHGDLVLM